VIHVDTSFVIDLLRETGRDADGPAVAFIERQGGEPLGASVFVLCELLAGAALAREPERERERVERVCSGLDVVYPEPGFASIYAEILGYLRRRGEGISTMDLLIAAAARQAGATLVTRNTRHFERVPGLALAGY
jgi:predicted nucleic acid-binding protein